VTFLLNWSTFDEVTTRNTFTLTFLAHSVRRRALAVVTGKACVAWTRRGGTEEGGNWGWSVPLPQSPRVDDTSDVTLLLMLMPIIWVLSHNCRTQSGTRKANQHTSVIQTFYIPLHGIRRR